MHSKTRLSQIENISTNPDNYSQQITNYHWFSNKNQHQKQRHIT